MKLTWDRIDEELQEMILESFLFHNSKEIINQQFFANSIW
jgi:hypothetical protein